MSNRSPLLIAAAMAAFLSPPSLAQHGAPAAPEQTAGAPREGLVTVVHLGADASVYRARVQSRAAELAGVNHRFTSDPAEFATLTGAPAPALEAGRVTIAVVDLSGRALRVESLSAVDSRAFDAVIASVSAATRPRSVDEYNLPKSGTLAIDGYDPVAYFTEATATKGSKDITSTFRGVQYRFAYTAHRDLFNRDPLAYLPTYGGWCASAMGAKSTKVEIDPKNFKVKDGRLFLFYKDFFSDALKDWNKHEAEWEPAADRNWQRLTGESPSTGSDPR